MPASVTLTASFPAKAWLKQHTPENDPFLGPALPVPSKGAGEQLRTDMVSAGRDDSDGGPRNATYLDTPTDHLQWGNLAELESKAALRKHTLKRVGVSERRAKIRRRHEARCTLVPLLAAVSLFRPSVERSRQTSHK
jgi:hypothetical protein